MEVWTSRPSAQAHISESIAAVNLLSESHGKVRKMAIAGRYAVAVIHHDDAPITAHEISEDNDAVRGRDNRLPKA